MSVLDKLNTKIVGLLLATIFLSLLLVTVFFTVSMNDLYRESSRERIRAAITAVRVDMRRRFERMQSVSSTLQQDKSFVSSLYLLHHYKDPDNYQSLVFDAEKEKLLKIISRSARRSEIGYLAIYDMDEIPVAYVARTSPFRESGFYTIKNKIHEPVIKISDQPVSKLDSPFVQLMPFHLVKGDTDEVGHYHFVNQIPALASDLVLPIYSDWSGPRTEQVGWVQAAIFLDQKYVDDFFAINGIQFAIRYGNKMISSRDFFPSYEQQTKSMEPDISKSIEPVWLEQQDGLGAAIQVSAGGRDERALLLFGLDNTQVFESLDTFRRAVLLVIFFSAMIAIPVGVYFTRRAITGPVELLTAHASKISDGSRELLENFEQRGELGTLASALNVMVKSLDSQEHELRSAQKEIDAIIGNSPAVIYIKDTEGKYLLVNPRFEELFGVTNEGIRGNTDTDIFPEEFAVRFRENDLEVLHSGRSQQFEEVAPLGDEEHIYLSIKFPLVDDSGDIFAVCGILTDITERKRAENQLLLAKRIIESANEAIIVTDTNSIITDVNAAYEAITGYSKTEAVGHKPAISQSGKHDKTFYQRMWKEITDTGKWEGELWDRRKNGELYPVWMSIYTVFDDNDEPSHYVGIFNDITQKKETEDRLQELAYFDVLTGLPNRLLFRDRLGHEIAACRRHESKLAVIFIDLDHFKLINDTQGHLAGDKLLEVVGKRLQVKGRDTDTIARMGGDEFTIVLTDVADPEQISVFANDLLVSISAPMDIFGQSVTIGASAGIAIFPEDGEDMESLIKNADIALYQAKEQGRNTYRFFSSELQEKILARLQLEERLREAVKRQDFLLHYQPKFDLIKREMVGVEALVRWQTDSGIVMPDEFIYLAEEIGLIVELGEWVLETACRQVSAWKEETGHALHVAVNLSAAQLRTDGLVDKVKSVLDTCGIGPELLELELTESMVMDDVEHAIEKMRQFRSLGIELSMDDFGTGYSSLGHLKRFPLNSVKIDKSFVMDLGGEQDDAAIIEAIVAMADRLKMNVIAEGIENEKQLEFVTSAGCHVGQGYFLGRPMPAESITALLNESRSG